MAGQKKTWLLLYIFIQAISTENDGSFAGDCTSMKPDVTTSQFLSEIYESFTERIQMNFLTNVDDKLCTLSLWQLHQPIREMGMPETINHIN